MKWTIKRGGLLLCHGCLAVGNYDFFNIPTKCPNCGSGEVWSAGDTWSDEEAASSRARARYAFIDHGHGRDFSPLVRENCGACCLGGYRPRGGWGDDYSGAPNYGGWERCWVEAGRSIPPKYSAKFLAALSGEGAYSDALRRDVQTYGVTVFKAVK